MIDNSHHKPGAHNIDRPSAEWDDSAWTELTGFGSLAPELAAEPQSSESSYAAWLSAEHHDDQDSGRDIIDTAAAHAMDESTGYAVWLPRTEDPDPATVVDALDIDDHPAAPKVREALRPTRFRGRVGIALVSTLASATVISLGAWVLSTTSITRSDQDSAPQPATATASVAGGMSTSAAQWCEILDSPERVSGNGAGSRDSGPQVILALEHTYYVERTAAAIRVLLAPEGRFGTDEEIQAGIDAVPTGTTHCVNITAAGTDRWSVSITERRPLGSTVVHHQLISTTQRDDRNVVAAVEPT
ncbi:hypothetical protein ACQP1G_20390 [Nocardia sp. CA-107356]|uniref:hypothetical protein n=1 Tax=Nocardia sp. CA-107356 TaxID=3239972 RepID=UPI003D9482EE